MLFADPWRSADPQQQRRAEEKQDMHVKPGDTIKVHFTGMLDDGTTFVSPANREPLKFTVGRKGTMAALQRAVIGMQPGESKIAKIPAEEAYGPYRTENVVQIDKRFLPKDLSVHVGQRLRSKHQDGRAGRRFKVVEVSDSTVTLDANHALAGRDVIFQLELVEIASPAPQRLTKRWQRRAPRNRNETAMTSSRGWQPMRLCFRPPGTAPFRGGPPHCRGPHRLTIAMDEG